MAYNYTQREDGRNWFVINNLDEWRDFTRSIAGYEPEKYPCLVTERITEGYCKKTSEFFVRYDV